ncbi:MAG: type IV pilin protein, partial [Sutterella wadsworthensis]
MNNSKRGFTLIEIVMVLVLLGILAAVAIPKYYDLKTKAEEQTAK